MEAEALSEQGEVEDSSKEVGEPKEDEKPVKTVFKMPLIASRPNLKNKTQTLKQITTTTPATPTATELIPKGNSEPTPIEKPTLAPNTENIKQNQQLVQINYKEPQWGIKPPDFNPPYNLEILKSGKILSSIELIEKSYFIFGRLPDCDVVMEHPTISRYHAVLQYRSDDSDEQHPKGFYVFDLGSTHGTFLNKNRVTPRCYNRIQVGHMIKFGNSTRMYILQGPEEDQETESPLTVTELKAMRIQQEEKMKLMEIEREEAEKKRLESEEEKGIDWGMGEDAEDEDPQAENPFALEAPAANEDLYIDDPKKTLRGWFEREGYDLEYIFEEKGPGHFLYRVQLPLETPTGEPVYAEAQLKGKKKEAVVACALEACRILDRHGVLRQATHESRKKKSKDWEKDDYYDSDDDTFLDRTGAIERKRQQRLEKAGKTEASGVETYETLMEKYSNMQSEILEIERTIQEMSKENSSGFEEVDSLEAYMKSINNESVAGKKLSRSRLKMKLINMKKEEFKLEKLLQITKPTNLSSLVPAQIPSKVNNNNNNVKKICSFPKSFTKVHDSPIPKEDTAAEKDSSPVEEEEDEDNNDVKNIDKEDNNLENKKKSDITIKVNENLQETKLECANLDSSINKTVEENDEKKIKVAAQKGRLQNVGDVLAEMSKQDAKRKNTDGKKSSKRKKDQKFEYDASDPNYSLWLPPQDQCGDGSTKLNEKYGY